MKLTLLFASIWMVLIFTSCVKDPNSLSSINSESFNEKQIQLHFQPEQRLGADSWVNDDLSTLSQKQNLVVNQLDEMISMTEQVRKTRSDSVWVALTKKWTEFHANNFGTERTPFTRNYSSPGSLNSKMFPEAIRKWAELNAGLVRLSGEVKFGDAFEKMVYGPENIFIPEKLLKSVIFTHVFDQIFINIIGSSSMDYQHTTGGNVRIIQETNYPQGNEMTLKTECNDFRYMDIFIRIPSWAVNPTVTHGNVKYVARPGEYCQISKKWITGDEIRMMLKN
jgi:hypothetical protein